MTAPPEIIAAATAVSKSFRSKGGKVIAVNEASLELRAGEVLWLRGESGSGKTTLLNLLGGLTTPDAGSTQVDGIDWQSHTSERQLAQFRRQKIGFVFQSHNLVPYLNCLENVAIATAEPDMTAITETLTKLGLEKQMNTFANALSGGEQQRVAIARAILNQPLVLLADEPISGLDDTAATSVLEALAACANEHTGVVIASHQQAVSAVCTRLVTMRGGQVVASRGEVQ